MRTDPFTGQSTDISVCIWEAEGFDLIVQILTCCIFLLNTEKGSVYTVRMLGKQRDAAYLLLSKLCCRFKKQRSQQTVEERSKTLSVCWPPCSCFPLFLLSEVVMTVCVFVSRLFRCESWIRVWVCVCACLPVLAHMGALMATQLLQCVSTPLRRAVFPPALTWSWANICCVRS